MGLSAHRYLASIGVFTMLSTPACVTERPGYYSATSSDGFTVVAAGQVLGEQCYFETPEDGIITDFAGGLSVSATMQVDHDTDSQGFRWEKSGTIMVQLIARDDIVVPSAMAQISVDGSDERAATLDGEAKSKEAKALSPYSIFFKRRPYLKDEPQLALLSFTINLEEKRVKHLTLQLPEMRVGGMPVTPPFIVFERQAGVEQNEICSEF